MTTAHLPLSSSPISEVSTPLRVHLLPPALSLARRELVRFVRQRNRIIGAFATPIVFWLLIGLGMGNSFKAALPGGQSYVQFFFPGTVVMILLFTAIFSTISIIEDRREGFLQSVLVAPVPRMAIVLGKIFGGTILATAQGAIFLLLAPLAGIPLTFLTFFLSLLVMLVVSFALTGLGFCIAWRMSSTQGFHAIMNLFLMPMWFLSGALFPSEGSLAGLKWVIAANPLSYGLSALRKAMYWHSWNAPFLLPLGVSLGFAMVMLLLSTWVSAGRIDADLQ